MGAADLIASGGVLLRSACGSFEEAVHGLVGDHLDTLAGVSLLLQSADTRRGLAHAADSTSALRALRGGNGRR